jgi:hypothetical protein
VAMYLIGCEKPIEQCKECTYFEDDKQYTVFVCGEELAKYERDNYKCVLIDSKNGK